MALKNLRLLVLAVPLMLAPASSVAQLVRGNPGQAENNAPDSRTYRAADEASNHPRRNPRHRVCKYHKDFKGHTVRRCRWK